jgi:hypothetical protein
VRGALDERDAIASDLESQEWGGLAEVYDIHLSSHRPRKRDGEGCGRIGSILQDHTDVEIASGMALPPGLRAEEDCETHAVPRLENAAQVVFCRHESSLQLVHSALTRLIEMTTMVI